MSVGIIIFTVTFTVIFITLVAVISIYAYNNNQDAKLLATATDKHRGTWSERKLVLQMLKSNFDSRVVFHDLYIKRQHSGYAQIDMVIPTKVGIFVFEIKAYSGWIFGNCNHQNWTQCMQYGKNKYKFYNPVKQNESHILALRSQLQGIGDIPYYSIIVFYGSCELKKISYTPPNTYICYFHNVQSIINHIFAISPDANYLDKHKVMDVLNAGVQNGANPEIQHQHLKSVNKFNNHC